MIPTILEISACMVALISGIIGVFAGYGEHSVYLITVSWLLIYSVFAYLTNNADLQQMQTNNNSAKIFICRVLHGSIYGIFALQIIIATLMVK